MRVYLASAFPNRFWMRVVASVLTQHGHTVLSQWHDQSDEACETHGPEELGVWAKRNSNDIVTCDVAIVFAHGNSEGGYWTEMGMALAVEVPVVLVGHAENVFAHHPNVRREVWLL